MSVDICRPISASANALGDSYNGGAPEPSQPKPSLMSIPVELRLEIYSYLLHQPSSALSRSARSYYTTSSPFCCSSCNPINGAILRANRQINSEATAFLYADNEFLAHPSLLSSLPRLRPDASPVKEPAALRRIRRLRLAVRIDCEPGFSASQAISSLSGLDELTVHILGDGPHAAAAAAVPLNLRLLEGVRGIRHVRFQGGVCVSEAYLEWLAAAMTAESGTEVSAFVPPVVARSESGIGPDEQQSAQHDRPSHVFKARSAPVRSPATSLLCSA